MQAEQEHNPEQEETVEQETVEQEQTAEQKHEHVIAASYSLLSAQLAFAEAGERDIAGRVAGMGEFMFGKLISTTSLSMKPSLTICTI